MAKPVLRRVLTWSAVLLAVPCSFAQTAGSGQSAAPAPAQSTTQQNISCGAGGCVGISDTGQPVAPAAVQASVGQTNPTQNGQAQQIRGRTGDASDTLAQPGVNAQTGVTAQSIYGPPPIPANPPTDFERYVQASTGHALRVFGMDYFQGTASSDFSAAASLAAPADFVVGPGDQVRVRTVGGVSLDVLATVDRNGYIYLPEVGTIQVAGMRLSDVQASVRSAINRQFRNFDLTVTLGQLRSIQVFLLGEARQPGVHTVSSLSSLINALFASGGPSSTGSLRDIQLKRDGKTIVHLDVYDLLLNGDKHGDVRLEPGDIIFIPLAGPQAAVDGDVNKPAIFELLGNTSVDELVRLAGGLTPVAATDRASLDRIVNHDRREVQDFPLTGAQKLISVQGGDVLRIFPISPRFDKAVTLRGNVGQPGRYAWHEGMRVSDLIPSRQFLITRRYYNEQNSLTPAVPAQPFSANPEQNAPAAGTSTSASVTNRTTAVSQTQAAASATAPVVAAPPTQPELGNHETEINWNYAVVERLGPQDLKTNLIPFALGEAIDNPTSPENKVLQPGDVVTVYSRDDINLPVELRARFVRIDGEVVRPGVYRLEGNETLRDLVTRAGGIAPHGYLYAAQFTRESVRIAQDAKIQQFVAQAARDTLSPANQQTQIDGRVNDLDIRRAYVNALSQIRATGRITLQITPGASGLADVPEVALQDGDRFFVPPQPTTVDVLGNVFNAGSLLFAKGATVHHYLKLAGDKTRTGDKGQEFLLRADGTVLSRETHSRFDRLLIYPGDTVIVPPKLKTPFNFYQLVGLTQSFGNIAITALALSTIR
ncbi:SLBB domain-containing protein [Terriglobus sp.]|uniref:SLBB domain-containing protein n=1 Tax=Terriglobus sp. TaxID=1889013 RepID=UPI003B000FF6